MKRALSVLLIFCLLLSFDVPVYAAAGNLSSNTVSSASAALTPAWLKSGSRWWYRHSDGSYTTNGWEQINKKWYYFDMDGWMQTGWIKVKGEWYYLDDNGAMHTGWKKLNNKWYLLAYGSGRMLTGWHFVGAKWYCFHYGSGAMLTGWVKSGNDYYYLDSDGAMVTEKWVDGYYIDILGKWVKKPGLDFTKTVVKAEMSYGSVPADAEKKSTTDIRKINDIVGYLRGLKSYPSEPMHYYGGGYSLTLYYSDGTSLTASIAVHPEAYLWCEGMYYKTSYKSIEKLWNKL